MGLGSRVQRTAPRQNPVSAPFIAGEAAANQASDAGLTKQDGWQLVS